MIIKKGNKMVNIRPRYNDWKITFKVAYDSSIISEKQLLNLYDVAGFCVGLHDLRPERGGGFGMFQVERK